MADPIERLGEVSPVAHQRDRIHCTRKRNVPPFKAAREHYSMCAVMTVNQLWNQEHLQSRRKS
jgi:hypothetical protein